MTARCPSELALEAHLLDPARSGIAAHVASCARCAARLERMRAEGEEFARSVFPATLGAIEEAAARRPWWRRPAVVLPVPALAALAALLLLVRPPGPPEGYLGVKGTASTLGLTLFTPGPTGATPVLDGGRVAARAAIRFRVRAASDCNLWIASIDSTSSVSRLFPSRGEPSALIRAGELDLPGGALLDGQPGAERIYAVCTRRPLPWAELESAVRAATGEPARVRDTPSLDRLPAGAAWTTLLLEKQP